MWLNPAALKSWPNLAWSARNSTFLFKSRSVWNSPHTEWNLHKLFIEQKHISQLLSLVFTFIASFIFCTFTHSRTWVNCYVEWTIPFSDWFIHLSNTPIGTCGNDGKSQTTRLCKNRLARLDHSLCGTKEIRKCNITKHNISHYVRPKPDLLWACSILKCLPFFSKPHSYAKSHYSTRFHSVACLG